jgi:hypothetical protein
MAEMSRLRRQDGSSMLVTMTPPKKWRALLVVLTLGLWAGGAAAQTDDESGWFDEPSADERPQLKIHGKGQYDPPPPDFRSDPGPGPSAAPGPGPEALEEDELDDGDREDPEAQQRAVGEFSPRLAPYGYWVDDPYYGRVWVPNRGVVGADFRPYVSGGHWELTADDEWLWASDYPFGGITFHYGRWAWLSGGVGWGWVPGYTYAPAWVNFRVGSSGYIGWGPAPPYSVWRGGVFVSIGGRRAVPYIFCPTPYVFSSSLPRYVVHDRYRVRSIAASTYRYRPRYVSGSVRVRSPSVREARIPNRYVPTRRVIAQPRGSYVAAEYRGRDSRVRRSDTGAPRGDTGARRGDTGARRGDTGARRGDAVLRGPSESRYRSGPPPSRERDARPRSRSRFDRDPGVAPSRRAPRGSSVTPVQRGTSQQAWQAPPRATRSETRRAAPPPAARDDSSRRRPAREQAAERRDAPAARGGERRSESRGAPSRGGPSRGGSPAQQRSRSRDGR